VVDFPVGYIEGPGAACSGPLGLQSHSMDHPHPVNTDPTHHPLIRGLIEALPERGANWPVEKRRSWLLAMAYIFDLVYSRGSDIRGFIQVSIVENSAERMPQEPLPEVTFTGEERTNVLRYILLNAQGGNWPIDWNSKYVNDVAEKIIPRSVSSDPQP